MIKKLDTPLTIEKTQMLKAGEQIELSGTIYTARDAAHKRLVYQLENNKSIPFNLEDNIIYYVGPTPAKEGEVIGSAGPTTSYRMDPYTPKLLELGLKGMIGKGNRSDTVIQSMIKNSAVYFAAVGGAAALLSNCIISSEIIAFDDLGTEAVRRLRVKDLPLIVAIDTFGNNLYESEKANYRKK